MTTLSREALLEILSQRYTAKHYDRSRKISDEDWSALLESVRLSPSSLNLQPWRLVVVTDEVEKKRLLSGFKDSNQQKVLDASHLLIFTVPLDFSEIDLNKVFAQEIKDGRYTRGIPTLESKRREEIAGYQKNPGICTWASEQAFLACGIITFAASALGIDATILGGIHRDVLDELLELTPRHRHTTLAMCFGYARDDDSNKKRPKSRFPLKEILL